MIIELWVFGAGIMLLPFMKFRKRAIVFLSFGLQCFLLFLQFGKSSVLDRFDDYFRKRAGNTILFISIRKFLSTQK